MIENMLKKRKKQIVKGGIGASIIVIISIVSPILTGYDARISNIEKSHERLCVKVSNLDAVPAKLDKLQDDIDKLEKLIILCNKDNPELVKYLELNK